MLYGALTGNLEDILKSCGSRMLRYMHGESEMAGQDLLSSEEAAKRCGLKIIQDKLRQKRLQWFGHVRWEMEGEVLRLVEEIEVSEKKERRKTKENSEIHSEEGFGTKRSR